VLASAGFSHALYSSLVAKLLKGTTTQNAEDSYDNNVFFLVVILNCNTGYSLAGVPLLMSDLPELSSREPTTTDLSSEKVSLTNTRSYKVRLHAHTHTYIHAYIHTHTHTHTRTRTHVHVHVHTHTHTPQDLIALDDGLDDDQNPKKLRVSQPNLKKVRSSIRNAPHSSHQISWPD
jgi:hypothetical protein